MTRLIYTAGLTFSALWSRGYMWFREISVRFYFCLYYGIDFFCIRVYDNKIKFCKHESELLVREYRPWVPIGRTLVSRPKMFYMDETLFNLDVMVRGEMRMEGNHTGAALEILVVQG